MQRKLWGLRVKNTTQYAERNEQKREQFIAEIDALPNDSELYHIDESGFDEYYSREYDYAPRGEPVIGIVSVFILPEQALSQQRMAVILSHRLRSAVL